jgi:PAS domain S-box-containing protein
MDSSERLTESGSDDGRYRLLVDAITDYAIYMLDPSGIVTSWNAGAQRFKGYTAAEIIGHHFSRFYTPEDQQAGAPALALETARTQGRFEKEGWRVRKDGARFWAHVVIDPIRTPSGDLIGFAKITRDLTERRLAEEALLRSEQQFKLLVQGLTDYAIYMLDPDGLVSSWNAGAQRIKGYLPQEIIGQHFSQFYSQEERQAGAPALSLRTAAREGRFEQEGWRVRKDGSRFWAHVVIDTIRGDQDEVIGFAKITRDITERKEGQRALDLARQALFQSQKLEAIGQLTGGIAHDFNNLLMAILGSLELVQNRLPPDPRVSPFLDNAIQGAQRGASLTQRMLAFARRQELKTEAVDVAALVRGMQGLLERSIGPTIRIKTRFAPGLALASTDMNQLEAALLNLTLNARDAMPAGGLITIEADEEALPPTAPPGEPGRYVRLSVTDDGQGMDEETLARALEPFFTTKGVGKGTGLGLSMVHGLAEQSGGALRLTSRAGAGTTVEILLPMADPRAAAAEASPGSTLARKTPALTVLAVDDDSLVLLNTCAMLEELGHRVLQADCGRDALEIIEHEPRIDLMVSDQAMPGMTGVQLAAIAKARRPGLQVILATGYAELPPGTDPALLRLAKPFRQVDLATAIEAIHPDIVRERRSDTGA